MFYRKPHFYDQFICIAGRCPDTCCAGWQIVIDGDSLEKYSKVKGGFGNRLLQSIDWEEGTFLQFHGRCSCLNEENLCDLYQELGETYLCETCRMYPRHVEEFDGVREFSLSLSCPEAAKMMLTCKKKVEWISWETQEEEPEPDEEFDFLLYSALDSTRELLFELIQNRSDEINVRMGKCLETAKQMEEALEKGVLFEVEEELKTIREKKGLRKEFSFRERNAFFNMLSGLEVLRSDWGQFLEKAKRLLFENGEEEYENVSERLRPVKWEQYAEQLLIFFVYTYFNGAVYDDEILSKVRFAVNSTECIRDLYTAAKLLHPETDEEALLIEVAWRYAREIEHSDQNLDIVEQFGR